MAPINPCILLPPGHIKNSCMDTYNQANKLGPYAPGVTPIPPSGGHSIYDALTGSYDPLSVRHLVIRIAEVVIGLAMVVVGVKALISASPTTKVIVQGAKKVAKS